MLSGWYVTDMPILYHKWNCSVVALIVRIRGSGMRVILSLAVVVSLFSMASAATALSPIMDITLTQDNLLQGQLVMRGGQPKSQACILVSSDHGITCRTTTNDQGLFAVKVARGGMHVVSHGETSAVVRAWTQRAAPPSAKNGILMVSDEQLSRANLSSRRFRLSPSRYGPIETAVIVGAVAGVVYLAADDDDGS